jgi:hypothetical protein
MPLNQLAFLFKWMALLIADLAGARRVLRSKEWHARTTSGFALMRNSP